MNICLEANECIAAARNGDRQIPEISGIRNGKVSQFPPSEAVRCGPKLTWARRAGATVVVWSSPPGRDDADQPDVQGRQDQAGGGRET